MAEIQDNARLLAEEPEDFSVEQAVIKVIGVGNGGCNAISNMKRNGISDMELIAINTDAQSLAKVEADRRIVIGRSVTGGRGAGTDPETGRKAAEVDQDKIKALLEGTNMLFLTTGMGGGTGTGVTPVIAKLAREMGILVIAILSRPFSYEGEQRMKTAEDGIKAVKDVVNAIMVISNDKLLTLLEKSSDITADLAKVDEVLLGALRGVYDMLYKNGLVNVDFADVQNMLGKPGSSVIGTGVASGPNRAKQAVEAAIQNPLLDDFEIKEAGGILVNIVGAFGAHEVQEVMQVIGNYASTSTIIKPGYVQDPEMGDALQVTVIMTGLKGSAKTSGQAGTPSAERYLHAVNTPLAGQGSLRRSAQRQAQAGAAAAAAQPEYIKVSEWLNDHSD